MQTCADSIQEYTESAQASQKDMEMCLESVQRPNNSIQEFTESIQERSSYSLIRVNRFAEPIPGEVPLQDKGI